MLATLTSQIHAYAAKGGPVVPDTQEGESRTELRFLCDLCHREPVEQEGDLCPSCAETIDSAVRKCLRPMLDEYPAHGMPIRYG